MSSPIEELPSSAGSEAHNQLPTAYEALANARFDEASGVNGRLVEVDIASPEQRLLEYSEFIERLAALAPVYEAFEQQGWQPDVIFVPPFSGSQWESVFARHGIQVRIPDMTDVRDETVPATADLDDWDVAIMATSPSPALGGVDFTGRIISTTKRQEYTDRGINPTEVLESLPGLAQPTALLKVQQFLPDLGVYLAAQIANLERDGRLIEGDKDDLPIDPATWLRGVTEVPYVQAYEATPTRRRFGAVKYAIEINPLRGDEFRDPVNTGIRPTLRGSYMVTAA